MTLHSLSIWIGVATAFVAAALWLYASLIPVPTDIKSGYENLSPLMK
jgi:hypothetical protein